MGSEPADATTGLPLNECLWNGLRPGHGLALRYLAGMFYLRQAHEQEHAENVIRESIARMLGTLSLSDRERAVAAQESEWVRTLYSNHVQTFHGELDRSWGVLKLFVPLSLSPFAAVLVADRLTVAHVLILGFASLILLGTAELYVRRIGHFERMATRWLVGLQTECGMDPPPMRPAGPRMRQIRIGLILAVGSLWVLLGTAVALGWFD